MNLKGEATGDEALFQDEAEVDDFIRTLNTQHLGSLPIAKTHYAEVAARCEWPLWETGGESTVSTIDTLSSPLSVPLDEMA